MGSSSIQAGLTHWGQVTNIWISKITIIDSDNGLSPGLRQTIIWTNAGTLLIRTSNLSNKLQWNCAFSFKKTHLKMSSAKWLQFCLSLNVLNDCSCREWPNMARLCIHTPAKLIFCSSSVGFVHFWTFSHQKMRHICGFRTLSFKLIYEIA